MAELLCWDLPVMDHAQDLALAEPEVPRDHLRVERAVHLWERSGVCSSCMRVAFPHLVSPPIFRWRVAPLGYLTIRMLSAGVGISGCVVRLSPLSALAAMAGHFPRTPRFLHTRSSRGYSTASRKESAASTVAAAHRQTRTFGEARGGRRRVRRVCSLLKTGSQRSVFDASLMRRSCTKTRTKTAC